MRLIPCAVLAALAAAAAPGLVAAQATTKPAEPLGRLFFTPAQRASLDIARTQRARTTLSTETTSEETAPAAQTITYGGMVRRSDGKSTVWINNRPINDQEPVGGATLVGRVRPDGGVSLQVPQSGRSVDLKPGQSIELLSGTIEEGYSRKPVVPEPTPAVKPSPDAKAAKPAANSERAREERDREDRERQLDKAARSLRDATAGKPVAATGAPSETPR